MLEPTITRGYGLLENFLAKLRAKKADELISPVYREGRILDLGCGSYPLFLLKTNFSEKFGLDRTITNRHIRQFAKEIKLIKCDVGKEKLPFGVDILR